MTTRTKPRQFKADEIAVCVESFVSTIDGVPVAVPKGTRLKGDHEAVKRNLALFLPDGASAEEISMQRQEIAREAEAAVPVNQTLATRVAKPLKAGDALICIAAGPSYGKRVPRTDKDAKRHPRCYVPVVSGASSRATRWSRSRTCR